MPLATLEVTFLTPLIPATASSIFLVTCASISAGAAPGCETFTRMIGTSMLGKRVIGRALKLCQPMTIRITKARMGATGLRMDQAEKFMGILRVSSNWGRRGSG